MEQQQYYSSDEEIAWGPLTLREIKKEFTRQKRPEQIKRRQTEKYLKPTLFDYLQDNHQNGDENEQSFSIAKTNLSLVENTIVLSSSESDSDESIIEINSSNSFNEFQEDGTSESNNLKEDLKTNSIGEVEVKYEDLDSIDSDYLNHLKCTEERDPDELDCTLDVVNRILEGRLTIFNNDESFDHHETYAEISLNNSQQKQFLNPPPCDNVDKFKTPRPVTKLSPGTRNKYGNIISPVAQYIKSGPHKSRIPQMKTANNLNSAKTSPNFGNKYQNIISPVAHYIKNGPYIPLVQNVPAKTVTNLPGVKFSPKTPTPVNTNNVEFPKVFYKPSKQTKILESEEMHLPGNIQKLMPQKITITKHEGRIKNTPTHIDSSVDLSMLDNTRDDDVSMITVKKTY